MQIPWKKIFFIIIILFLLFWGLINVFVGHLPEGLAFISIGLAFFSIFLAFISVEIANESDEKMKAIAKAIFMEIVDDLQDRFLEFKQNITNFNIRSRYIWKWRTNVIRSSELIKWINPEEQDRMTWAYISLFEILPWKDKLITNFEVRELLAICTGLWILDISDEQRDKLTKLITVHIGERKKDEEFVSFLYRKIDELSSKDDFQVFRKSENEKKLEKKKS